MTAAAAAAASRSEILSLLRELLRTARNFPDYNIREYAKRRTLAGFRQNKSLSNPNSISSAVSAAVSELHLLRRQSSVYSLYEPPVKTILDKKRVMLKEIMN